MSVAPRPIFTSGQAGYHSFRIPALLRAEGRLLAFAEGRRFSSDDHGEIDIVVATSDDGGETWSAPRLVRRQEGLTTGNPVPFHDAARDAIGLVFCTNRDSDREKDILASPSPGLRRVWFMSLDRDGKALSRAVDITRHVTGGRTSWVATGPGGAVRTADGFAVPINTIPHGGDHAAGQTAAIITGDHGLTWRRGAVAVAGGGNEGHLVDRGAGSLALLARYHGGGGGAHRLASSEDGGLSWGPAPLPGPKAALLCKASAIAEAGGALLMLVPTELRPARGRPRRARLALFRLAPGASAWAEAALVDDGFAAYSDMAALPDGGVGAIWECGEAGPYERIVFARLPGIEAR